MRCGNRGVTRPLTIEPRCPARGPSEIASGIEDTRLKIQRPNLTPFNAFPRFDDLGSVGVGVAVFTRRLPSKATAV